MKKNILSKRVIRNICQLIIGGFMLIMSYNYVNAHDAEKTNFISGLTILKQKVGNMLQTITGKSSSQDLDRQQEMLRNYKELESYLIQSQCVISTPIADIQERIQLLSTMKSSEYRMQALSYGSFASQVYSEMQTKCKK